MSDLLIRGMEMPKTMSVLAVFPNGYVAVYDNKDTFIGEAKAVPVPPHGRLGDLDALAAQCDDPYWCVWLSDIEAAPTIIPASNV